MGFRFRKSINLGNGFRVNVSKSGVGYSWGTKGVRFTKTATGKSRKTVSIPGTGLSYTTESKKHRAKPASARKQKTQKPSIPPTSGIGNNQPPHKKHDVKTTLLWCGSVFFLFAALGFFPSFASFTALALSAVLFPLQSWQDTLHRFLSKKVQTTAAALLFLLTMVFVPATVTTDSPPIPTTSTSSVSSTTEDDVAATSKIAETASSSSTVSSRDEGKANQTIDANAVEEAKTEDQPMPAQNTPVVSTATTPVVSSDPVQAPTEPSKVNTNSDNNASADTPSQDTAAPENTPAPTPEPAEPVTDTYVLNTDSGKFHTPNCSSGKKISPANRAEYQGSRDDLINQGYKPCKNCHP